MLREGLGGCHSRQDIRKYKNMKIHYNPKLMPLARKLRSEGTLAEVLLWFELKGRKVRGYKFTRQKPIGDYIVDFFCNRLRLTIEIDGITHENNLEADEKRQEEIENLGIRFLRFDDLDVRKNLNGVLMAITDWIEKIENVEGVNP